MSTFFNVVLVILAILALLGLMAAFWVRSKMRKVKAYSVYAGLSVVVEAMQERAAKPEHADDQELAAQLASAETAKASAKAALDKDDFDEAVKIMRPVIEELAKYKRALNQERARQASQDASRPYHSQVIDVEVEAVNPVAQLSAPAATPIDPTVAAPADTASGAIEDGKKDDSKK